LDIKVKLKGFKLSTHTNLFPDSQTVMHAALKFFNLACTQWPVFCCL